MRRYVFKILLALGSRSTRLTIIIVMLSEMCANEGDEFQLYMHMSGSKSANQGGPSHRVCELWLQGLCVK
jgi:hypothetical protein